jgi:hypothetical protein
MYDAITSQVEIFKWKYITDYHHVEIESNMVTIILLYNQSCIMTD